MRPKYVFFLNRLSFWPYQDRSPGGICSVGSPVNSSSDSEEGQTWELLFDVLKVLLRDSSQYPLENRREVVLGIQRGGTLVTGQSL